MQEVARRGSRHISQIEDRWEEAKGLLELEEGFRKIVTTRQPGQTVLNKELEMTTAAVIKADLKATGQKISEWAKAVGIYFNIPRGGEFEAAMTFFFTVNGFDLRDHIEYTLMKQYILVNDIQGIRLVSDEMRAPDIANSVLATLG